MRTNKWLKTKLILLIFLFIVTSIFAINYTGLLNKTSGNNNERTFSTVEKIVLESTSLSVNIIESDVKQVTIKDNSKSSGLKTEKPIKIDQKGNVVSIKQRKKSFFLSFVSGTIVIEVPRESKLEFDVSTVSGDINHDAQSRETLRVTSVSGEVNIHQGGTKVITKTTSGEVRVLSPFEELKANSVSGSIYVIANQDSKQATISTVSGSVKIQLEKVTGYDFNYSTTSGSIKDAYEKRDYSKSGNTTKGNSTLKIDASSVSGSIKLMDWNK